MNMPLYTQRRYLLLTIDPVHVGVGGYRLGRVDMTIAREPGTNLPKVPGTSLAGAARSYAAMRYGKRDAAGQHQRLKEIGESAKKRCPILYTFGTANQADGGRAGTVSTGDAHLLLFPVYSMAGPVWLSTADRLREAFGPGAISGQGLPDQSSEDLWTTLPKASQLNLGWLLLPARPGLQIQPPTEVTERSEWQTIASRIVLSSDRIFTQVVSSNLEVRTSVSIDQDTGTAEGGALFTYEAIPRAAWLFCDLIEDDYRREFPETDKQCIVSVSHDEKIPTTYQDNAGEPLGTTWSRPLDVAAAGLTLMEHLGVGGMGSRGFGRIRPVAYWDGEGR